LFGSAVALFVLAPFTTAHARVPGVLPSPCVPTKSTIGSQTVLMFSATAQCTFDPEAELDGASYDIVAVGGGGGGGAYRGGGGGGGEVRTLLGYTATLKSKLVIVVGAGGTGGIRTATGVSTSPAAGQSSLVWTVDAAATSPSRSPLVEAKGGGPGGADGSGGAAGTGGSGGRPLATGQGGVAQTAKSDGTPGAPGAQWSSSSPYFGGGGGGGICAHGTLTPDMIEPLGGGRDGGGASAGKRPAPVGSTSEGSDAVPGSGSGGGAGAGCANAFAGRALNANGGAGGRGTVILVVTTPTERSRTTTGATSNPVVTKPTERSRTTTGATSNPVVTKPTERSRTATSPTSNPVVTKPTERSRTTTGAGPPTSTDGTRASKTVATLPTASPTTATGGRLRATTPTLSSTTPSATAPTTTSSPPEVTIPAPPELVPANPVFYGTERAPSDFFRIDVGVTEGRPVRGSRIGARATNLAPASTVRVVLRPELLVLGEFAVGPDGTVTMRLVLPDDIGEGDHSLTFEAVSLGGTPISSVTVFSVDRSGRTETVVAPAEAVGAPLDQSTIERSAVAAVAVYDTERHVARTAAITATAAVVTSLAGTAVAQTTGGLGTSIQGSGGGPATSPLSPSPVAPGSVGSDMSGLAPRRREDEQGLTTASAGPSPDGDDGELDRGDKEANLSGTEANLGDNGTDGSTVRADRRGLWMLPGYGAADRFLRRAVTVSSRWSVLATRILQDGHWLRAAAGVVAPVLWAVGFLLGAGTALGLPGLVVAPEPGVVFAVVALSILDAMVGASAWLGFTVVALLTGNVTTLFDARTLLGLGVVFVALPSIGSKFRPFSRTAIRGDDSSLLDRVGDYVIMPVLLAYTASAAYSALNGLSGLEMVQAADTSTMLPVVLAATYARLLGEDATRAWYPLRSVAVRIRVASGPRPAARAGSVALGAGLYLLVAAPFFGLGWRTWLMVGLVTLVPLLGLARERFPNISVVHRFFPRGLLRFVVMMFLTAWFGRFVLSLSDNPVDAQPVAVFMLFPGVLVGIVDLVGREGGEWRDSYPKRIAGLAVWLLAVAVLSGRIAV